MTSRTPTPLPRATDIRLASIVRRQQLTPRMVRVTVRSDAFLGAEDYLWPGDAIKLFLPAPGEPEPVLPIDTPNGRVFPEGVRRPDLRAYTIRAFRPELLEADLDVLVHGDTPGSVWAITAKQGDRVGFVGPRRGYLEPPYTGAHLLIGDESVLPAIAAIVENLDATATARVILEVATSADELPLSARGEVQVTWLHRGGPAGHGYADMLEPAVRALGTIAPDTRILISGETSVVRAIRRYLTRDLGIEKSQIHAAGYWRLGMNATEMDNQILEEFQAAQAAGKGIADHHDVDAED